jgi:hypothetical protein
MKRQIEKIRFRLQNGHVTCKDAMLFISENYGKFGIEIFKQQIRNEIRRKTTKQLQTN